MKEHSHNILQALTEANVERTEPRPRLLLSADAAALIIG
jgi:hypothetical protein